MIISPCEYWNIPGTVHPSPSGLSIVYSRLNVFDDVIEYTFTSEDATAMLPECSSNALVIVGMSSSSLPMLSDVNDNISL